MFLTKAEKWNILYLDDHLNERKRGGSMGLENKFKALSDPTRRKILDLLKNGRMTAGEISSHFEMTGATVSHHLSVLVESELILEEKAGKYKYFELNTSVIDEIMLWISSIRSGSDETE